MEGNLMEKKEAAPQNMLGTQPIKSMIWKFAIPGIISSIVNALHNLVDQIFIGWGGIGDLGIAATNISFPLTSIVTALSALLGMGGAAMFNLALGDKQEEEAKKSLGSGLFLMALMGILIGACAVIFLEPMLYAFGATDAIMPYARPYAAIISLGIPFGIFATGSSYFIRADGNPNYSSAVLLSAAVFNIIFDPVFLFVFHMGIQGIALATVLGQVLSAVLALFYLVRRFKSVKLAGRDLLPKPQIIVRLTALGAAPCFTHIAAMAVQITQSNILRHYGALSEYGSEIPLAAAGAVSKIMILFMSCVIGISLGCQPIYGFNYGSKQYDRVKETYKYAVRYGTIIAAAAFLLIELFPRQILRILGSSDPLFYRFAVRYMRIFLLFTFVNAIQPITSTFFTAIGKASLGFWMALIRQVILLIPLLLILPRYFGIEGIFFAGPLSDGIAVIFVISFAVREMRSLTKLQEAQANNRKITGKR